MTDSSKLFDKVKDAIDVSFFHHERSAGIDIGWSQTGIGWGHLTFGFSLERGEFFADCECMSVESVTNLIRDAAPILAERLMAIERGEDVSNKNETDAFSLTVKVNHEV